MSSLSSRRIYLSYRHEETADVAGRLPGYLRDRFGGVEVFMNWGSIQPSADFAETIRMEVGWCSVLLALMGRQWATVGGREGRRALDDPDDQVRLEIQTALELGIRVIPVLVGGARMPSQQELPIKLHGLAQLNALELSYDRYVHDVYRLGDVIERVLSEEQDISRAPATGPSTTPRATTPTPRVTRGLRGARARQGRSVFISYRRQLSWSLAQLVRDYLSKHRFDPFVDVHNLDSGEFPRAILSEIEAREHFIVLLQPGSLDRIGEDGDWLRREIAHALAHGRNVVPVTANGFEFRPNLMLPPDVAKLPSFSAVPVQMEYFDAAMERLRTRFLKMRSNP